VYALIGAIVLQAEEEAAEANDAADLYPHWEELVVGALAFAILFFFMWKWVFPRINTLLEERRVKIQGELEKAEETRRQADTELAEYRAKLAEAQQESNRIIEEARRAAEEVRADLSARAQREAAAIVAKAQEEIRAERDRVFQQLRSEVAEIAVGLAGRVVGESLDAKAHQQLIDRYIDEVAASTNGKH
jgi:F-type H+-transporting ATPase subunit b